MQQADYDELDPAGPVPALIGEAAFCFLTERLGAGEGHDGGIPPPVVFYRLIAVHFLLSAFRLADTVNFPLG